MLVFKVFFPDRAQQRRTFLRDAFPSGLWSRSLILPVEAFGIFAQDRVHLLLRTFQLVFMKTQMSLFNGFFALFPQNFLKKNAKVGAHSSPRVPASVSSSTPSAQLEGFFIDENDDVWMRLPSGQWTLLGSDQHVIRDKPG